MSYVGKWVFHSIGAMNENDEMVYLRAEGYLKSPMPCVDESDEEADTWVKAIDEDGYFTFAATRFVKAD